MASATKFTYQNPPSYYGSRLLEPYYAKVGLAVDQGNFVFGQLLALSCACIFRYLSRKRKLSVNQRHWMVLVPGIFLTYFCFGHQISHLLLLSFLCYMTICACTSKTVHQVVLAISLLYLSYLHLLRQLEEYGGYYIDITGPAMIIVQKVTSLAFCIHDGMSGAQLNEEQEKLRVDHIPSALEFAAYLFQFTNVLCGPMVYYTDYIEFIDQTNFRKHARSINSRTLQKSLWKAVFKKLSIALFFGILVVYYCPRFSIYRLQDERFLNTTPMWIFFLYLQASTAGARFKYYFAWTFGEAVCNAAGLGLVDIDKNNTPNWNLLDPVDIFQFEFSRNLREALQAWNKPTQVWLRRTSYDRVVKHRTLITYLLSALWHGFYPGYYLTFLTGALFTKAARVARRNFRHHFQKNKATSLFYDLLTCIFTRFMMAYLVFPFVMLTFFDSIKVYARLYFYGHILAVCALVLLPTLKLS
ncbi:lysophospholipid acyltransferase 6-like [Brevipalpus obovatus]|uniref:lysophospholipid acyltransferase 6-like n=1 Tax=Brevipalpus obovatus TaxID=246614 RepID=UPI003D9EF3E2